MWSMQWSQIHSRGPSCGTNPKLVYLQMYLFLSAYLLRETQPLCKQLVTSSGIAQPRGANNWLPSQSLPGFGWEAGGQLIGGVWGVRSPPGEEWIFDVWASRAGAQPPSIECSPNPKYNAMKPNREMASIPVMLSLQMVWKERTNLIRIHSLNQTYNELVLE